MAFLINRIPASRIDCLHSLMRMLYEIYSTDKCFSLREVKYQEEGRNIKAYCNQLKKFGDYKYCPFLDNPLDPKGCNLTNGVVPGADTTKSKEVSNTVNALHALGFLHRDGKYIYVTDFGAKFAETEYDKKEMSIIIREAVLNYGPSIGIISQIQKLIIDNRFSAREIVVGYPNTNEYLITPKGPVQISTGSQEDSNVRTRSCILTWLTTAGFIKPIEWEKLKDGEFAHIKYRDKINSGNRNFQEYELVQNFEFEKKRYHTLCPLDFSHMTKDNRALRENGIADIRISTINVEEKIKARRFAICYILNKIFEEKRDLKYESLEKYIEKNRAFFCFSDSPIRDIVKSELFIANQAGIPFKLEKKGDDIYILPLCGVNLEELKKTSSKGDFEQLQRVLYVLENSNL